MRIVINHLTRMRRGYICVAGLDLANHRHVRPIPRSADLRYRELAAHGGLFEIGAVIDLGYAKPIGKPPEVEDHEYSRRAARPFGEIDASRFWSLMKSAANTTLIDIFGRDLHQVGRDHAATDPGHGQASLGILLVTQHRPELVIEKHSPRDRIRIHLRTGHIPLSVAVTDIRLYGADHLTPDPIAVQQANERLTTSVEILLCVGLSRAYSDWLSNQPELHWLQVNNLHFFESPLWRLPAGPEPSGPL